MKKGLLLICITFSLVVYSQKDCSMIGYETYMKKNNNEDIGFDTYMKTCRGEIKVVGVLPFRSYRLECEVEAEKAKVVDGFTNPDDKYYFIEACIREKEKGRGQDLSNGEGKESDRAEGLPVTISKKQFSSPSSFNLQSHLNSTCGKTSQVTIGGVTCYCVPEKTLDYKHCVDYGKVMKAAMISEQANTMTTQARAQVSGTKAVTEINELSTDGEDVVIPGFDASKQQVGIQMQGQGTKASISAALSAQLRKIANAWVTPQNLESYANCGNNEACNKAVEEALSNRSSFANYQSLQQLYASLKSTDGNLMSSLQGAAESFKNMKQIEKQKETYLNTLATEDTTSYACTVNPALCEENDSTNKEVPGTGHSGIGFGGGYTTGSIGASDNTGGSDYNPNTTYNAPSDDTSFENEEVAALAPSFDNTPQGSPSGASGASANSSGGGSTPTAREQKMAQQKKLKSMEIRGKSLYHKKKRKRSRFGSTASNNLPKFENPLKGKNPFAGLFDKKSKKSKKEVNRALANDGVKRSGNSLFKRITRAHIRKVKNNELLVYRIQ